MEWTLENVNWTFSLVYSDTYLYDAVQCSSDKTVRKRYGTKKKKYCKAHAASALTVHAIA